MTRNEILSQVRKLLSDEEAPYLWRDEELDFYYELAVRELCRETGIFTKTVTFFTVNGQYLYDYPSSFTEILLVKTGDRILNKVPFSFIDTRMGIKGQVMWYCLDYLPTKILLHYTPEEDGQIIKVTGSAVPESDEIDSAVPEKYSHFLIEGVLANAFTKSDSETVSPFAEKYKLLWLSRIEQVKRDLERQYYNPLNRTIIHRGLL